MVEKNSTKALNKFDRLLKKFQYAPALNQVLIKGGPDDVVCLIKELVHRDALRIALGNRDDISLEPIVQFIGKYICHPRYNSILVDVTNVILGKSP
jgi:U3 small nucleolar RNA-associated protein 15